MTTPAQSVAMFMCSQLLSSTSSVLQANLFLEQVELESAVQEEIKGPTRHLPCLFAVVETPHYGT